MMFAPLLLLALRPSPDFGPMLPPGINENFQTAVLDIETKMKALDFAGAAKQAAILPKKSVVIQWDDSKVPDRLKKEYASQRDKALNSWSRITGTVFKFGTLHPDLKFSFTDSLPNALKAPLPPGVAYFWSDTPGDVRLETVVAMKRRDPLEGINPVNVENEVATSVGSYFGLGLTPFPSTFMGRTDDNSQQEATPSPQEMLLSMNTLSISSDLRAAIKKHTPLLPTRPKAFFDPKSIDIGTTVQGDPTEFSLQVTNTGDSPLAMRFTPDCSCVSTADHYQVIQPGSSYVLKGGYNTMLTVGDVHHSLLLTTNDFTQPTINVPVHVVVKPRYVFVFPEGNVVDLPESGKDVTVYLVLSDDSGIEPMNPQLAGLKGDVKMEPWTGTVSDPALNDGKTERHGYKLTVHLSGELGVPGRDPATLWVASNNPKFPVLQANFFGQRGIVVLPTEFYLGEVGPGPRKYSLQVSGPAHSFHVKKVTSNWPHLTFQVFPNDDGTAFIVQATYDGKGEVGPVLGSVDIETDDPKQPVISIPIHATIQ